MDKRKEHTKETADRKNASGAGQVQESTVAEMMGWSDPSKESASLSKAPGNVTAGGLLKKERLAQGLSLEIIHETTKIPLDALRAIEEGYKIRSLSPFILKGL